MQGKHRSGDRHDPWNRSEPCGAQRAASNSPRTAARNRGHRRGHHRGDGPHLIPVVGCAFACPVDGRPHVCTSANGHVPLGLDRFLRQTMGRGGHARFLPELREPHPGAPGGSMGRLRSGPGAGDGRLRAGAPELLQLLGKLWQVTLALDGRTPHHDLWCRPRVAGGRPRHGAAAGREDEQQAQGQQPRAAATVQPPRQPGANLDALAGGFTQLLHRPCSGCPAL
mmetsp:Transcript_109518/g.309560  ORF Transcript_109518/g.309560 Transcript_109518/m.309560 type:complete len:225 (-) Transcript_109518:47-721(-)